MKKLKMLLLHDGSETVPAETDFAKFEKTAQWSTEISVLRAAKERGHSVSPLGFDGEIYPLIEEVMTQKPDVIFNLSESCLGEYRYDKNVPALLELLNVPYTGTGPVGLMVCNNKAMTKKILVYHNILVPRFCVYHVGETVKFPVLFNAPFFVKPLQEEASTGICQRSFAANQEQCKERVEFVHKHLNKDALVEEYIEGRELYVGVIGQGKHLKVLPVWELKFDKMPDQEHKIATYRAKWNDSYRAKWGIRNECADPLPDGVEENIIDTCTKAYRVLNIDGYARFDLRLTPNNEVYIIEANANPELAKGEDFAASAEKAGISYEELVEMIVDQAIKRNRNSQ
ncbi:MAG: hypothetical protein A2293_03790 [Elusimicrobia bacterium RIFOXYB2_FULL_49_7]|nr:MAG: hypothetical protein A2293_03790 [Elusimicrobia bacterium RIFOXYB2_FULL_49_7]